MGWVECEKELPDIWLTCPLTNTSPEPKELPYVRP